MIEWLGHSPSDWKFASSNPGLARSFSIFFHQNETEIESFPLLISTGFLKYPLELRKIQLVYTEILQF